MAQFTVTANAAGAVKAVDELAKAVSKITAGFTAGAKEAKQLERAAQSVVKANETPLEKYNRRLAETAKMVKAGTLSFEEGAKAVSRYGQQLDRAGKSSKEVFGSRAIGDLRSFAAQFVGVQTAVSGVLSVMRQLAAERERVAQGAMQSIGGLGALAQLAATEPTKAAQDAKMASLLAEARAIYASGGALTMQEAAEMVAFSTNSAGLSASDRSFAASLRAAGVMQDVGGAATAYTAMRTAMGESEVGSFRQFMSKSLAASSVAPAQANEIALATSGAGASLRTLGLTDEFGLAATAMLSKVAGSASEGGTLLGAFLKQVEKAGLDITGKSGTDIVAMIGSMPESQQGIGGVLGDRAEAVKGFRILRDNLSALQELEGTIGGANTSDLAQRAIELTDLDFGLRAAKARQASQNRRDVALGDSAALQNLLEAAFAERQRTARADGGMLTELNLGIERAQVGIVNTVGSDRERRAILQEFMSEGSIRDETLLKDIRDALRSNVTTRQE